MASEQFSLCWDNFHKNMSSGMNSLLENEDLVDVTLAVEGKYLKAHKMVLSVCSPYFKELFKTNPCKHPIVFMKDVSYVALSDLLQFMYQGEVQVSQENLTTFIKTAEALQIKGLTGDGSNATENDVDQEEKSVQHLLEDSKSEYKQSAPVPRPKKIAPQAVAPPPAKRQRSSTSSSEMAPSSIVTKTEPVTNAPTEFVQFKMEPYDQSQTISIQDDDEQFGEGLEENVGDETEDYSMMEGNEEEPQAGTSTEGTGEGQGTIYVMPAIKNIKLVVNENVFVVYRQTKELTRWRCNWYSRTRCKYIIFIAPGTINPKLIVHNNMFLLYQKSKEVTRWRCSRYLKNRCKCRLQTSQCTVRIFKQHNHAPINPKLEGTTSKTVNIVYNRE
ncbi:modifier of mdg4-like isoform X2 [Coccinella septempunctata]|uniref:modifier of mdg4-like isoform X2 n=1 Tax=Coccinella septempunctata TaxID=41139 RepID=UPI001D078789|nr:modifier of mdg4-like isoform X2 [Coccinella septempunctata]